MKIGDLFQQKSNGYFIRVIRLWDACGDCSFVHHSPDGLLSVCERWGCTEKRDVITADNTLLRLSKSSGKPFVLVPITRPYHLEEYQTGIKKCPTGVKIVFE